MMEASTTLCGLSVGILSAAAVAISTTLPDLASHGVESVRIAFRRGVHVDSVSRSLETREAEGHLRSWAYVVTGIPADVIQQELDRFHEETVCLDSPENMKGGFANMQRIVESRTYEGVH